MEEAAFSYSDLIFHDLDSREASEIDETEITGEYSIEHIDNLTAESVCGRDQREKVIATQQMPYMSICKIYSLAKNGRTYGGTGWLIDGNKLITAGHVVHKRKSGGWKKSFIIVPGKSGLTEPYGRYEAISVMTTKGWFKKRSARFDMGAILLNKNVIHDSFISPELGDASYGEICGYPSDRDRGIFQYRMSDNLTKKNNRFRYYADTHGGQSGSPLLKDRSTAIGIHNYGGCPNKASDLYEEFIEAVRNWK